MEKQIDFKEKVAQIVSRIKQQAKNAQTVEFELQSNTIDSKIWRREIPRTSDIKNLENIVIAIITNMHPDAVRIITWIDGKKEPVYDVKISSGAYIPAVDEAERRGDQVYSGGGGNNDLKIFMQEFSSNLAQQLQGSLSGLTSQLGQAQINEIRTNSENEIAKMRNDNEIEKLNEKIRVLQEKLTETEGYLIEEEKENDNLKKEIGAKSNNISEMLPTVGALLAGVMGKPDIAQMLMGLNGGGNAAQLSAGDSLEGDSPRGSSEMEIQEYIQTMEPDDFTNFEMLVLYLKQYPKAMEVILKQLMAIETTAKQQQSMS